MYELLTLLPTVLVVQLLVVHVVRCGTAVSRIKRKKLPVPSTDAILLYCKQKTELLISS